MPLLPLFTHETLCPISSTSCTPYKGWMHTMHVLIPCSLFQPPGIRWYQKTAPCREKVRINLFHEYSLTTTDPGSLNCCGCPFHSKTTLSLFLFFINILSSLSKLLWNAVSVVEFCFVICENIPTNSRTWEILNWICRRVIGCHTLLRRKDWTAWCTGKHLGQALWGKSVKSKLGLKVSSVVTLPLSSMRQQRHHHPHTLWSSWGSSGWYWYR